MTLVLTTFSVATLRYGLNLGWIWLQELYIWMHGTIIMLGAAYTLLHDEHVRIDVFYRSVTNKSKAWINLVCSTIFLIPSIIAFGWFALPYVIKSWERVEASREAGGMHGLFLWKTTMLFFCCLLLLQALAIIIRSVFTLQGKTFSSEGAKFQSDNPS